MCIVGIYCSELLKLKIRNTPGNITTKEMVVPSRNLDLVERADIPTYHSQQRHSKNGVNIKPTIVEVA